MLQINLSNSSTHVEQFSEGLAQAHTWLQEASGRGNDFVGWVNLPRTMIRMNMPASRPPQKKFSPTARHWWSSALAAAIWAPGR